MKFLRINENAIKCIITQEEMDEQGMQIDDLMDDRNKAETFMRYILQQAKYEVDFDANGAALNVQLSIMPCGDIQLMISDDRDALIKGMLSELKERLVDFQSTLQEKKKELEEARDQIPAAIPKSSQDMTDEEAEAECDKMIDLDLWSELDSLENAISLAKSVPQLKETPAILYKHEDHYYLELMLKMTRRELAGIAFAVSEYSMTLFADNPGKLTVQEHGEVIIKEKAIEKLAAL